MGVSVMAFTLPEFPITCDIYAGPWNTKTLRLSDVECNLAWGKRVGTAAFFSTIPQSAANQIAMVLLLPALTDIRDGAGLTGTETDIVECPSGSGRWYGVLVVDDFGKGFPNEHRGAVIYKIYEKIDPPVLTGCTWPFPIP